MSYEKGQAVEVLNLGEWVPAVFLRSHTAGGYYVTIGASEHWFQIFNVRPAPPAFAFGDEVEVHSGDKWLRGKYVFQRQYVFTNSGHEIHHVLVGEDIYERTMPHIRHVPQPAKPAEKATRWAVFCVGIDGDRSKTTEAEAVAHAEKLAKDLPRHRYVVVPLPSRYVVCEPEKTEWRDAPPSAG